jgi:hypothetical protein
MSKTQGKQRHKAKRQAKKLAERRRASVSPLKRLAEARGEAECWMSDDFHLNGQTQVFAWKQGAGLAGVACFLIDRGVVGLKDAWTRLRIDRAEFLDMIDGCKRRGTPLHRVGPDEARRWVAGGIRWAHDNGMRLPRDWPKTVSFIGGVGDWASADVSAFVKEFAGHPEDLRQRLVNEPFDSYVKRRDVNFVFSDDAPYLDQRAGRYSNNGGPPGVGGDELDEDELESIAADVPVEELNAMADRFTPAALALTAETIDWLGTRGETPTTEVFEAWRSVMLAAMLSKQVTPDADEEGDGDFGFELLRDMSARIEESAFAEYSRAVGQVLAHLETDSMMMQKAVLKHGLARGEDERRNT